MPYYVFIIANQSNTMLHVGFCSDIEKTMNFYNEMPTITNEKTNKLIYFADAPNEKTAKHYFDYFTKMTLQHKLDFVRQYNPELLELTPQNV